MGVKHSRKGVKHPLGRVRTLLETPEIQMCGVAVASEGKTRDEALGNAKEAIEAHLEVKAEQLKQRTRGDKVVVIVEAASPLVG